MSQTTTTLTTTQVNPQSVVGNEISRVLDPRQVIAQLSEVLGPDGLTQGLLETLKVPSGSSAPAWSVMDLEQGEISKKEVTGVILATRYIRGFWKEKLGTRPSMRPDCKSSNSIIGDGTPGGSCHTCPFAQFGSAVGNDGKPSEGQACKQMLEVWMIRPDMLIPSILRVPPTSLKNGKQYLLNLTAKGIQPHTILTAFTLAKEKNPAGVDYQKINFRFVGRLEQSQVDGFAALRQYVQSMVGQIFDLNSDDYVQVDPGPATSSGAPAADPPQEASTATVQPEAVKEKKASKRK